MLSVFRVLCVSFALCLTYGAFADDVNDEVNDVIKAAIAKDNPDAAAFDDVKYLNGLVSDLNWANSDNPERRELYQKLVEAVKDIDDYENMSLKERLEQSVSEKKDALEKAKDVEQSTENKLLGGASIAAMGLAGMGLASGLSEKKSMEEAEQQMKAYLATFRCDWADGKTVAGGETAIELPGGNELIGLVTEYKTLATDLKARKESLGLKLGIESEEILDKSESGLYDDESAGKTDGAFTSLSRALLDETSEDAAEWAADKEQVQKKIKTSATVAAVAAVASVAANLAINNKNKNAISSKVETTRNDAHQILDAVIKNCNDALISVNKLDQIIIGVENLYKIKDYTECNN